MTILDVFVRQIYSKKPDAGFDPKLEQNILRYIEQMQIDRHWQEAGLPDTLLERYLDMYLAPFKFMSYDEAANFFEDHELLGRIDMERSFFENLNSGTYYSEKELNEKYTALRELCAPLIGSPKYDSYIDELLSRARIKMNTTMQ